MTESDRMRILRKIKACLAHADEARNSNEHERATALRQANAMMDKYGIEILELGDADDLGPRGESRVHAGMNPWRSVVFEAIAKLYGCKVYRTTGRHGQIYIIGRKHYRSIVEDMGTWICNSIDREAKILGPLGRSFKASFRMGASRGVYDTSKSILEERAKGKTTHLSTSQAMVLVDHFLNELALNNEWLRNSGVKLSSMRSQYGNRTGFAAGQGYGANINLSDQMGGKEQGKLR